MIRSATILILGLAAGACTPGLPQTLDQRLKGKDPAEMKEILRVACLDEAEWPQRAGLPKGASIKWHAHAKQYIDPRVSEMKTLCRKMDALADPDAEAKQERGALVRECSDLVRKKQVDGGEGFSEHGERTQHICDAMLGQKVGTGR